MKRENSLVGAGLLAALAASLCCITPLLAVLAGIGGMSSAFSWMEPARPYLIGLTVVALGLAWYFRLKPADRVACECTAEKKSRFLHSKAFLAAVTVVAALMLAFPHYAHVFYPKTAQPAGTVAPGTRRAQTVEFTVEGMTCTGCARHIERAISGLPGVIQATASFEKGNAIVIFDETQVHLEAIQTAINTTGYSVVRAEVKKK